MLSISDHATSKNYISAVISRVPYKAIPYWKGQRLKFQKKIISVSGNP